MKLSPASAGFFEDGGHFVELQVRWCDIGLQFAGGTDASTCASGAPFLYRVLGMIGDPLGCPYSRTLSQRFRGSVEVLLGTVQMLVYGPGAAVECPSASGAHERPDLVSYNLNHNMC